MSLNFSEADKTKYMSGQYIKELKLYFPDLHLTILNDEIYEESMTLEESIFDGNGELSIVGCISNRFSIEIRHQNASLKNANIQVSIRIDSGNWNRIFTGYVDSVETVRDRSYMKLQCYDALYKFQDKDFYPTYSALTFPVSIQALRFALFNQIGITQVTTALANDNIYIPQTIEDDEIAVIDAIRAICEMNGVFGRINSEGKFQYVRISSGTDYLPYPSDATFPSDELFPGDVSTSDSIYVDKYKNIAYEDYKVAQITKVVVREGVSDPDYGEYGTNGNALLIEDNMWCRGLDQFNKDTIAQNIFEKVKYITYRPFEATNLGLPWVQVGDAVTYYIYDYSSGVPVVDTVGFSLLSRYLKGIQWLEDRYSANGLEYQPIVQSSDGSLKEEVDRLSTEVSQNTSDINDLISGKQNFIASESWPPTSTGEFGDLEFVGPDGENFKRFYRYEADDWYRVNFFDYGEDAPTDGEPDDIYLQNDGTKIIDIWQKNGEAWMDLRIAGDHIFLMSEHMVGRWINDNDVYERVYKLGNLPDSGQLAPYEHNIGGFGLILYVYGMSNENNVFHELSGSNDISIDGTYIYLRGKRNQQGYAYLVVGYIKPIGGYYPSNRFYAINTGEICTAWYQSCEKTAAGPCYSGMLVGYNRQENTLYWVAFCLSLEQEVVENMSYRYGSVVDSITYGNQTWYYSTDAQVQHSWASSMDVDQTQPESRRFFNEFSGAWSTVTMLGALLDSIYQ